MSLLTRILKNSINKSPSVVYEFSGEPEAKERHPKWDLVKLYDKAEGSWVLQEIFRTIIQEVKRPGWDVQFKFKKKCNVCGEEYREEVDVCECGSHDFREPDRTQLVKARKLLEKPNSQRQSFGDILTSIIYNDLVADQWYLSTAYAPVKSLGVYMAKEIYVEDPRYISPVVDSRGRLGKNEWFCPICYPEVDSNTYDKMGKCPKCGVKMLQVSYVQTVGGDITNLFGTDQMVDGSTYKVLPYRFGNPRLVSLWEIVGAMNHMDAWYYDTFKDGQVANIINLPGYTPDQVSLVSRMIRERERQFDTVDPLRGRSRTEHRLKSLLLGSQAPITVTPIMPDLAAMQTMDYYRMGIQACAGVYGVQLIFISQEGQSGRSAATQIRIEVQNRTIEEIQRDKEEVITQQLFPIFKIEDVEFVFGELEKKDDLRNAQIRKIVSDTALTWTNAGFEVELDDDGELKVSGDNAKILERNSAPPQPGPFQPGGGTERPSGTSEAKPKESGSTGDVINGTTTERWPSGTRSPTE